MIKSFVVSSMVAVLAILANPADAQVNRLQRDPLQYELSLKAQPLGTHTNAPAATINYMGTTVGGPTYTRALSSCAGLSGVGVGVTYSVQQFSVDTSGAYDVTSVQTGAWDGFLFVYQNAFDPANPLTNCFAANDDGGAGIGTSDILGVALTGGTQYFAVTTGFAPGDEGAFSNTITGPGNITLGAGGPAADLGITKTAPGGVVLGGNYVYQLAASNLGPDPATGVAVTDVLPSGVSFVSSTCGATEALGTVNWTIGNLANGAVQNCDITVSLAGSMCPVVSNTASIDGVETDPNAANSSATASNSAGNVVQDPGFEDGTPSTFWTEASSNFGTPVCDAGSCGVGGGTGANTGTFWTWFGGFGGGVEIGSMEQSLVIPTGASDLQFFVEFPVCATVNGASDFVRLTIDGTELWRQDATSALCNVATGYSPVTVPLGALANGAAHVLRFESTTIGGTATNFFIDDLSINAPPVCAAPLVQLPALAIPSLSLLGLFGLVLGIGGLVMVRLRSAV